MIGTLIFLIVLALFVVLFAWLAWHSWHARRGIVKWAGSILDGLLTLFLLLLTLVTAKGFFYFYLPTGNPPQALKVEGTPDQIARGKHIATFFCVQCHGHDDQLPLSGGDDLAAHIPFPLGSFVTVNLTPAGPLKGWSDGEILRILREGASPDGHRLAIMSGQVMRYMSDEDLYAVIAYLRSSDPVVNETAQPPDNVNALALFMLGAGVVPVEPPVADHLTAPRKAPTAEYGKYVVSFSHCPFCHGPLLDGVGGSPFVPVKAPSLRVVKGWTIDQFTKTIHTGVDPTGHQLSDVMPWKAFQNMDDDELGALYAYLKSLPAVTN
jgi:mono/diheme cytochrome c family protein